MHHFTCGISLLLCSINLFTPYSLSPSSPHLAPGTSSQSLSSLSPSVTPLAFYSRLKNSWVSHILSSIVFLVPFGLPSQIWNLYQTKWALALVDTNPNNYCRLPFVVTNFLLLNVLFYSLEINDIINPIQSRFCKQISITVFPPKVTTLNIWLWQVQSCTALHAVKHAQP